MNHDEFALFVEETKEIVLAAIRRHLSERLSAHIDDIAQETYFKAYIALKEGKFNNKSKMSTWLYVIARNEALRAYKKYSKELKTKILCCEDILNDIPAAEIDMSKEHTEKKMSFLKKILPNLPKKYSGVLNLFLAGKEEKEIASELSIPQGTVKSRLHRGKQMVVKFFERSECNE